MWWKEEVFIKFQKERLDRIVAGKAENIIITQRIHIIVSSSLCQYLIMKHTEILQCQYLKLHSLVLVPCYAVFLYVLSFLFPFRKLYSFFNTWLKCSQENVHFSFFYLFLSFHSHCKFRNYFNVLG
jgi:hypothetical protein